MITIGIPAYNQAQYLPDAIESALAQTTKAEIIVVNDGSTDNTEDIAKNYPVKLITQENKGLASARNTAIQAMAGEWFLPLDSDDILLENAVEKIELAISLSNHDIIAPSFKQFGVSNETIILQPFSIPDLMVANRIGYFSAIKKSALEEVGGYNPNMTFGWEDYDLWFNLIKRGKTVGIIQEPLVLYRTKERSMIHVANEHAEELTKQLHLNHPELWPS